MEYKNLTGGYVLKHRRSNVLKTISLITAEVLSLFVPVFLKVMPVDSKELYNKATEKPTLVSVFNKIKKDAYFGDKSPITIQDVMNNNYYVPEDSLDKISKLNREFNWGLEIIKNSGNSNLIKQYEKFGKEIDKFASALGQNADKIGVDLFFKIHEIYNLRFDFNEKEVIKVNGKNEKISEFSDYNMEDLLAFLKLIYQYDEFFANYKKEKSLEVFKKKYPTDAHPTLAEVVDNEIREKVRS